ncbi:hypothetical protein UlMin_007867 [Ulmus minor]
MESKAEETVRARMETLRLACDLDISVQKHEIGGFAASFGDSLSSIRARAREAAQNQGKLGEVKANLRKAEDDLVKALSVKTRKEAKRMAMMEALAARRARVEELKRCVQDQRARRDEYAAILSQHSSESEEPSGQNDKDDIHEAILWYNRVLGFSIEGGHGVKFTFKNISLKNPNEEYSFTIRHANNTYALLDCDPHLNNIKGLIHELNKTNGLFKLVRDMRQKFQEAAAQGIIGLLPQSTSLQKSSIISVSAPVSSISSDGSESLAESNQNRVQHGVVHKNVKKQNRKGGKEESLSPGSALSLRRSPRFKVSSYSIINTLCFSICTWRSDLELESSSKVSVA